MSISTLFSMAVCAAAAIAIVVLGYLVFQRSKSGVESKGFGQRNVTQTQKQGAMSTSSSTTRVRDTAYGLFLCFLITQLLLVLGGLGAYILQQFRAMSVLVGPLMLLALGAGSLSTFPFLLGIVFALVGFLGSRDRRLLLLLLSSLIMLISNVLLLIWILWAGAGSASLWDREAVFRNLGIVSMVLSGASLLLLDALSVIFSIWWFRIGRRSALTA